MPGTLCHAAVKLGPEGCTLQSGAVLAAHDQSLMETCMSKWINLLFLSFFTATLGEFFFFAFIDPQTLYLLGQPVVWPPLMVYSVGFFMFWALTALTAVLVTLMAKPGEQVNEEVALSAGHRPLKRS